MCCAFLPSRVLAQALLRTLAKRRATIRWEIRATCNNSLGTVFRVAQQASLYPYPQQVPTATVVGSCEQPHRPSFHVHSGRGMRGIRLVVCARPLLYTHRQSPPLRRETTTTVFAGNGAPATLRAGTLPCRDAGTRHSRLSTPRLTSLQPAGDDSSHRQSTPGSSSGPPLLSRA